MFALLLLKSFTIHLLTNQRLVYAQAQSDSSNSSEACICNSNICASCSIFIMCSSATSATTYSNACQLSGYNACKSSCPFKPSEGILYLQSQCLSTQNCSLIFSCGNNSSSIYLPCQSNSDSVQSTNSSGCLYCFKSSAAGLVVPIIGEPAVSTANLSSSIHAAIDSITAPTSSSYTSTEPNSTTESIPLSTSESIREPSGGNVQESTKGFTPQSTYTTVESIPSPAAEYFPTSTSEFVKESSERSIHGSTTESTVKSFAGYIPDSTSLFTPQSTTESTPVSTPVSISNSNSYSESTISTIYFSTFIPGALLLLVIITLLCKRRGKSKRRSVLPFQDTLRDFEGTLDDLKDTQNISTSSLHGDMLLFSKAASEKTILDQDQDINDDKYLGKLETQPFFSVMNNIYIPNGRLKPVPAKTQDTVSIKPFDPEMKIPELSLDKNTRKNINHASKSINSGFFKRITHEYVKNSAQIQDDRIDAPLLIYEKPSHVMIPKTFKNFEKRPSAGVAKCNLEDVIVIDEADQ